MIPMDHYELLAALFDYPGPDLPARVAEARAHVESRYEHAEPALKAFADLLPGDGGPILTDAELDEAQELFTRSFQVQAVTTLDIGYIAFGDDYKRAEVLVNLRREHRAAGIDCGSELADHLPNVLRLLARWKDEEIVVEFVEMIFHPALEEMVREFGEQQTEARNAVYQKYNKTLIATSQDRALVYRNALVTLLHIVRHDFGIGPSGRPEETSPFLASIGRELDIEEKGAGHKPSTAVPPPQPQQRIYGIGKLT
ncbi:MAG: hypothetical protein GY898_14430 [Proteobacteria bacterium]|nr:hypothetical protein [Pseudomonadota bacterium]